MTNFEHMRYGIEWVVVDTEQPQMRQFKEYVRKGKTFWRNYKRDIEGGVTFSEYLQIRREQAAACIINDLSFNAYSIESP